MLSFEAQCVLTQCNCQVLLLMQWSTGQEELYRRAWLADLSLFLRGDEVISFPSFYSISSNREVECVLSRCGDDRSTKRRTIHHSHTLVPNSLAGDPCVLPEEQEKLAV